MRLEEAALAAAAEEALVRAARRAKLYVSLSKPRQALRAGLAPGDVAERAFRETWNRRPPSLGEELSGPLQPPTPSPSGSGWSSTVVCAYAKLALALWRANRLRNWILVVEGPRGIGKTTYVYNALWQALLDWGLPPERAEAAVEEHFFWEPAQWAAAILRLDEMGVRVPFTVLDDLGQHASKYWTMEGGEKRIQSIRVAEALDTIKDVCGLLVVTTPVYEKIASFFREAADYVATLSPVYAPGGGRLVAALWYELVKTVSGRRTIVRRAALPAYFEALPTYARLPDGFWARMMKVRRAERAERLARLSESLLRSGETEEGGEEEEGGSG
jgi:hypothetical protein